MKKLLTIFLTLFSFDAWADPSQWRDVPLSEVDESKYIGEFRDTTIATKPSLIVKKNGDRFEIISTNMYFDYNKDPEHFGIFSCVKDRARIYTEDLLYLRLDCEDRNERFYKKPYVQLLRYASGDIQLMYHAYGKENFYEYNCENEWERKECPIINQIYYEMDEE